MPIKWIVFFIAVLFLYESAFAVSDRSHLSSDPSVKEARTLVQSRRFNEALIILRPLAKGHPDQTDVLFLIGLAAIEESQKAEKTGKEKIALLDEAIAALRKILINRPGLVRVRLELARAFFLKGNDDLARQEFERVLAGGPHPAVVANIRRFLGVMTERRRLSGYFGFTLAPDTNINSSSDEEIIYINVQGQLLPFRLDDPGEESGFGVLMWGGGEYQHPLGKRLRLRLGADISHREYKGRQFDRTFLSGHTGIRWFPDGNTEFSLLLPSVRQRWTSGKRQSDEIGVRFEIDRRLTRKISSYSRASFHHRRYRNNESLNGPVASFLLGASWLINPTLRTNASVGYSIERPEATLWRNSTHWGRLGFNIALPRGFTVGASGEFHRTKYNEPYFSFGEDRRDRLRIFRVSVFNRAFTMFGFSPQIVFVNEKNSSNSQLQDYKRNRGELRFVRQF